MASNAAARFRFIGHALAGDGPFRPSVTTDQNGIAVSSGASYLIRYPRESQEKYARRNEVSFYSSPLAQACGRFVGYLSTKPPQRELPHELYESMANDIDGKGSALNVFWQQFIVQFKARGSMLLLVDMDADPSARAQNLGQQIANRVVPYWTTVLPESVTDYEVGEDGKFVFVEFEGSFTKDDGKVPCVWRFDRNSWSAKSTGNGAGQELASGKQSLGECPVLIVTEGGDFPHFGPFASIADVAKRQFNAESELDEILRSQTFSLLTMQVPENTTEAQKVATAQTAGQTIGSQNMLVHTGNTPDFIAPPDGPAQVYMTRIDRLRAQIDEIGLNVAAINQQESGIAMKMRFQRVNAELSSCADRVEGLERRAWELSRRWLALQAAPKVSWHRDYDIADIEVELQILLEMQQAGMPQEVIHEQQKRVVQLQFGAIDDDRLAELIASIDDQERGIDPADGGNVVPIDRNASQREALMRLANGG